MPEEPRRTARTCASGAPDTGEKTLAGVPGSLGSLGSGLIRSFDFAGAKMVPSQPR